MSRFHHYEPCEKCRNSGRDNRGDNLAVYTDGGAHCFSCGWHRHPVGFRNEHKEKVNETERHAIPADFTREVPTTAWKWLLQYGLPYSYWEESVGYSPESERLVFCVGKPLQFSIGRRIEGSPPSERGWGTPLHGTGGRLSGRVGVAQNHAKRRKWWAYGDMHKHCEVIEPEDSGHSRFVVLTEDLISAHKVGQVTTAIPLFGVQVPNPTLYYLMNQNKPVILWLDKDQEGGVKNKAIRLQSIIQCPVDIRITDKDPKSLSVNEIKDLL